MRPTKKAAVRILPWLFIRGICGSPTNSFALNPDIVPVTAPDAAHVLAADTKMTMWTRVEDSLSLLHGAEEGRGSRGNAFVSRRAGMRLACDAQNFPITAWPQLVETWLVTIGMISR